MQNLDPVAKLSPLDLQIVNLLSKLQSWQGGKRNYWLFSVICIPSGRAKGALIEQEWFNSTLVPLFLKGACVKPLLDSPKKPSMLHHPTDQVGKLNLAGWWMLPLACVLPSPSRPSKVWRLPPGKEDFCQWAIPFCWRKPSHFPERSGRVQNNNIVSKIITLRRKLNIQHQPPVAAPTKGKISKTEPPYN